MAINDPFDLSMNYYCGYYKCFFFYGAKKTLILFNPYSQNEISYMFDLCSE